MNNVLTKVKNFFCDERTIFFLLGAILSKPLEIILVILVKILL